jgi:hypothetical protein
VTIKSVTWGIVVLATVFAVGWVWGASGRSAVALTQEQSEIRGSMTDARALVLEGRVSLFQANFGDASRSFDAARTAVERLQTRLRESGQADRAGRLQIVLAHLSDAQRLAVALDQSAHGAADEALKALMSAN